MPYMLAIELALLVLMVTAILYCHRLDRQLRVLRSGRDNMLEAARELGVSVREARAALAAIKAGAQHSDRQAGPALSAVPAPIAAPPAPSGIPIEPDNAFSLTSPLPSEAPLHLRRRA